MPESFPNPLEHRSGLANDLPVTLADTGSEGLAGRPGRGEMAFDRRSVVRSGVSVAFTALLIASLSVAPVGAAPELLDTLTVTAGDNTGRKTGFDLVQGQTYSLVLTGTGEYTRISGGVTEKIYMDAVYFFGSTQDPTQQLWERLRGDLPAARDRGQPSRRFFQNESSGQEGDDGSLQPPPLLRTTMRPTVMSGRSRPGQAGVSGSATQRSRGTQPSARSRSRSSARLTTRAAGRALPSLASPGRERRRPRLRPPSKVRVGRSTSE